MFLDALVQMYIHDPEMFWKFIWSATPSFLLGIPYGLYVQSQDLNRKYGSGWKIWKVMLTLNIIGIAWTSVFYGTPFDAVPFWVGMFGLGLSMVVMMFPCIGGVMTGMVLMNVYWFIARALHWIRNPNPSPE